MLGGNGLDRKDVAKAFSMATVGIEMAVPIVLGSYLDSHYGWAPWGVLVGGVLGFVGAFAHIARLTKAEEKQQAVKPPPDKTEPS